MPPEQTIASYGVGLDLLSGSFNQQIDNVLTKTANRIAAASAKMSVLFSAPLLLFGRNLNKMAGEVDRTAREATALMTSSFENVFSPEAQAELDKRYEELITRSLKFSIEYGEKATGILKAFYLAIGTGFPTLEDAAFVVEAATKAAAASGSDAAVAMDVLLGVINAYGLEASDAQRVSDILFQTVNVGKIEFDELAQTMGDVVGIAPLLGISLEELGAMAATATLSGSDANKAFTGMRQIFMSIFAPMSKGAKALGKAWGIPAEGVGQYVKELIELRGFVPVMREIVQATTVDPTTGAFDPQRGREVFRRVEGLARIVPMFIKMTDEEAVAIEQLNKDLASGIPARVALTKADAVMAAQFERTGKEMSILARTTLDMARASEGAGATNKAFSEIQKSMTFQADQAARSFDALKIVFGLTLNEALLPVIKAIGQVAVTLTQIPEGARRVIVIVGILVALLPLLMFGFSQLLTMISFFASAVTSLIGLALNPLVIVLGFLFARAVKAKLGMEDLAHGAEEAVSPFIKILDVIVAVGRVIADVVAAASKIIVGFVDLLRKAATKIAVFFGAKIVTPRIEAPEVEEVEEVAEQATGIPSKERMAEEEQRAEQQARKAGRVAAEAYAEGVEEGAAETEAALGHAFLEIGRGAVRSMLRGMDPETFAVFKDAIGLVRAEVQALGLDAEQTSVAMHNAQIALAQALLGDVSAWETLRGIIGDSVSLVQEYVAARQAAAAAQAAVEQAELNRRRELERLDERIAAVREKIRQFELDTAEIPERYTRGRRRQLDEELDAAQKERDERQKVLDAQVEAAKAQAKAASEHAAHLSELLNLELQLIEASKEEAAVEDETQKALEAAYAQEQADIGKVTGAFDTLGDKLGGLAIFLKGLFGEVLTPEQIAALSDEEKQAYERGLMLREALEGIAGAFGDIKDAVVSLVNALGQIWDQVPDWLKVVVAGGILTLAIGLKLIGAAAFAAGIGKAVTAAGGAAIAAAGGTAASVAAIAIPVTAIAVAIGGMLLAAYDFQEGLAEGYEVVGDAWDDFYKKVETDADGVNEALDMVLEKNLEVQKAYQESSAIGRLFVSEAELYADVEDTQKLLVDSSTSWDEYRLAIQRYNEEAAKIPAVSAVPLLTPEEFAKIQGQGELLGDDLVGGFVEAMLAGAETVKETAEVSLTEPIVEAAQDMSDQLVGESIIPEMVDTTIGEFQRMATGSELILTTFSQWVYTWGDVVANYWYTLWSNIATFTVETVNMMEVSIIASLTRIADAMARIPTTLGGVATGGTSGGGGGGVVSATGAFSLGSNLQPVGAGPVAAPGVGEAVTTATFTITNYWDAAVSEKDREELAAVAEQATYGAIVQAYSGGVDEVKHE